VHATVGRINPGTVDISHATSIDRADGRITIRNAGRGRIETKIDVGRTIREHRCGGIHPPRNHLGTGARVLAAIKRDVSQRARAPAAIGDIERLAALHCWCAARIRRRHIIIGAGRDARRIATQVKRRGRAIDERRPGGVLSPINRLAATGAVAPQSVAV